MIRTTLPLSRLALYHRRALPLKYGRNWFGKWGGVSQFHGRVSMYATVPAGKPVTLVDREMMNYVHDTQLRQYQIMRSYSRKRDTSVRRYWEGISLRRKVNRKINAAFITYMQYETKKTLEEQAKLVNMYGQVAVNKALGDLDGNDEAEKKKALTRIHRTVVTPRMNISARKHVATMKQLKAHRFDRRMSLH